MKIRRIIAGAAAVAALLASASCSNGEKSSYSSPESSVSEYELPTSAPEEPVPTEPIVAAADGPRLYIKDTTAKPGEIAAVTLAVENADLNWNMCGLHITYPNILKPEMMNVEERLVKKTSGAASEYNVGSVCMTWEDNLTEYLSSNNLGCLFFTEVFKSNLGQDGDIATFYFMIPEDAESGTEYTFDFYYQDTDMFINEEKDLSLQQYAFENWKAGTVTVE